jgi:anti-sigma factor RsiW
MKNCNDILTRLSAYHDGELPADQLQEITAHLAVCPACQQTLSDLQHTSAQLRQWSATLSPLQQERIVQAYQQRRWQRTLRTALGLSATAAVIAIIASLGWLNVLIPSSSKDVATVAPSTWEMVAVARDDATTQTSNPDQDVAVWMVASLNEGGNSRE